MDRIVRGEEDKKSRRNSLEGPLLYSGLSAIGPYPEADETS